MAILSKRLDADTFLKAQRFLQKAGEAGPDGGYCYRLNPQDDTEDLDAYVYMREGKIIIAKIWVMEYNEIKDRPAARNPDGENGRYAKILSEKYLNRFLGHLATVDVENTAEFQITLDDLLLCVFDS